MNRHFRYILPIILLMFSCLDIKAQDGIAFEISPSDANAKDGEGFFNWAKRIITGSRNYDTLYIAEPWGKWSISLNENFTQHYYYQITDWTSFPIRNRLGSSTGIGVSYLGAGVGLSVDFKKLNGKTKDSELFLKYYSNRFGGDLNVFNIGDFYDTRFKTDISYKNNLKGVNINTYYAFNHRKFSYPAAFSYSYIQKKSAGSVIAGLSFYHDDMWLGYDKDFYGEILDNIYYNEDYYPVKDSLNDILSGWTTYYLSLGAGYAYNLVPANNLMIHISIMPSILLLQKKVMTYDNVVYSSQDISTPFDVEIIENEITVPHRLYNFVCDGKISVIYHWKRAYVTAYYVSKINYIDLPGLDYLFGGKTISIYNRWNARLTVGYRF